LDHDRRDCFGDRVVYGGIGRRIVFGDSYKCSGHYEECVGRGHCYGFGSAAGERDGISQQRSFVPWRDSAILGDRLECFKHGGLLDSYGRDDFRGWALRGGLGHGVVHGDSD